MSIRLLLAGFILLLAGCGSSSSQPVAPTSTVTPASTLLATATAAPSQPGGTSSPAPATPRSKATSSAAATPTQAGGQGVLDKASGVRAVIGQVLIYHTYALLYVTMVNGSGKLFSPISAQPQFEDAAFTSVTGGGTQSGCGSDDTHGQPLDFQSVPPHATHAGWLRCDYPGGSKIFDVTWLGKELGHFNINV